jgi:hypothetical protein
MYQRRRIKLSPTIQALARNVTLCVFGFAIGRICIFPGFLDPMVPSHSDLYLNFNISQSELSAPLWELPRPMMYCWLLIAGSFIKSPEALWFIMALSSIVFLGVLISLFEALCAASYKPFAVVLYSAALFALPTSWQIYQHDWSGMLSGTICIVAIAAFVKLRAHWIRYGLAIVLVYVALDTKPTFGILMISAAIVYLYYKPGKDSVIAFVAVTSVCALLFLKDKVVGAPFVQLNPAVASIYKVYFDPPTNMRALVQYFCATVPVTLLPALIVWYALALSSKTNRFFTLLMPLAACSALAPMALIPNRVMDLYSWYGSVFLFAPVLTAGATIQALNGKPWVITANVLAVIATVAGLLSMCRANPGICEWVRSISRYNENVFNSLSTFKSQDLTRSGENVLICGLQGPYHPFKNDAFISYSTGMTRYSVLLNRSEEEWNSLALHSNTGVFAKDIDIARYESFAIYNE